jgi:Bacterial type II and III secretion system protein
LRQQQKALPAAAPSATDDSPKVREKQDAEINQIYIKAKFVSLPADDVKALNVGWVANPQGGRTGLLTEPQLEVLNEAMEGASDVTVYGVPRVITLSGRQAQVAVTKAVPVGGTNANVGVSLDVMPTFSTDPAVFELEIVAELSQMMGDPARPEVQTMRATNRTRLFPGQTVVFEKAIPHGGWLPDSADVPTGPRSLVIFVTPTVVDAAGNKIKTR